jgi:hypothetical protein
VRQIVGIASVVITPPSRSESAPIVALTATPDAIAMSVPPSPPTVASGDPRRTSRVIKTVAATTSTVTVVPSRHGGADLRPNERLASVFHRTRVWLNGTDIGSNRLRMNRLRLALQPVFFGSRRDIAGTVYGTIVVMGTLTAGSAGAVTRAWQLAIITAATVLVLWIAHVYAHTLGHSLERRTALTRGDLIMIARREASIPLAGVTPVLALALGAVGLLRETTAIWVALGFGVWTLATQGVRYARSEQMSRAGTLIAVTINVLLGLVIVGLKVFVAH